MMGVIRNIVDDNRFTPEDVPKFEAKLFFEGAKRRVNLERFAVLLFLSTVIATYGVLGDSTATVIGAMIIAPLMTPIMATAIGAFHLGVISFTTNSQITARVSPSLLDLAVALASGVAGAFAMSRDDVADSLPGVAISIALVPPLAVVGISLSQGQWHDAWGAMLLFLTNFLSILLAGGGTLALLGLSAASTRELQASARRRAFVYIALGTLLVAIPLAATSARVAEETTAEYQTRQFTEQWLAQTSFEVNKIDANGNQIEVIISGAGDPPPLPDPGTDLGTAIDQDVTVNVKVVPARVLRYPELAPD
jgi:uncharacterized membrane protein